MIFEVYERLIEMNNSSELYNVVVGYALNVININMESNNKEIKKEVNNKNHFAKENESDKFHNVKLEYTKNLEA